MSGIDLSLQPKQSEVFTSEGTEILYGGSAGAGKAGDINIPIPTTDGWKLLKDVQVGDKVFGSDGKPCNVVAATEVMYNRPCYRITLSDGNEFIVDEQHQWLTMDENEREQFLRFDEEWKAARRAKRPSRAKYGDKYAWLKERNSKLRPVGQSQPIGSIHTTKHIADTLKAREGTRNNHSLPLCRPVEYPEKDLLVNPYVLGFWLGDGTTICGQFTSADQHNIDRIAEHYEVVKIPSADYGYGTRGLMKDLRTIGVLGNKHIPEEYLTASVEQRWQLIHGLMDSDGYCSKDGKLNFDNTNKAIIDGFCEVARSLGIRVTVKERRATLYGKDCGASWRVSMVSKEQMFTLPRRADRQKKEANPNYYRRFVVSCEKVPSVPVRCIEVDSENHMFLWGKGYVPTHNSHLLRVLAITYSVNVPQLQTYLFRRTSPDLIANHMVGAGSFPDMLGPFLESKHVTINWSKNEIRFWNGSIIHLCHCQHEKDLTGYQGAQAGLLLLDELTHFTESMYRFLRGRVRLGGTVVPDEYKGKLPKVVCGSNPGSIGHNWVKKTFIDFAPANTVVQMPKEDGGLKRVFIPAKLTDNYALMENDPDYADRLSGLGTDNLVSAMLDGNWDIAEGGYFDDVWDRNVHVIKPFDIPKSFRIDRSFDWGSSKPHSVGFWAESDGSQVTLQDGSIAHYPRGTLFRIAEIYGWNGNADEGCRKTAKEIAEDIVEFQTAMSWGKRVQPGPADAAIYTKENGDCIADDMKEVGIRWVPADKRPGSRVAGWQKMRKLFKAAFESPRETPALYIFDTCIHFIRTVPTLPRDASKGGEDIDSKSEDHCADESRYRCNYRAKSAGYMQVQGL
jgi:hypothetical protein